MRGRTWGWLCIVAVCTSAVAALGQAATFTTDFEAFGSGDEVMFQEPRFSGSTIGIHIGQTSLGVPYDDSQVVTPAGEWCPNDPPGNCLSDNAYEISFAWQDPTNATTGGVRCTTFATASLNRPSIHLGGVIRFWMALTAHRYDGDMDPEVPIGPQDVSGAPSILLCLAITETGKDLPLGTPDTGGGDIEFVYLPLSDVIPAANTNGMGPFPPGGKRYHATTDLWPPENAQFVKVEIDLSTVTSAGLRGFSNNDDGVDTAGDGALDATLNPTGHGANRGALESIIFSNDPTDTTGEYFFIYIDDVEFEAPVTDPTPPPTITAPILRGATSVTVVDVSTNATEVRLKVDNGTDPDQTTDPAHATSVVFTLPHGAAPGDVYTATQTVGGVESSNSLAVTVSFPGPVIGLLPKDGDTTVRITGIDPEADKVELFVGAGSRGETPTTNGVLTIEVPTGSALEMGQEVTATQTVLGGTSDPSAAAIVTTSGIALVFCDDFEYANQGAFDLAWTPTSGDAQLQVSILHNATAGGSKSAMSGSAGTGNRSILITDYPATNGTDTHPVIWNLSFYDDAFNTALYRQYAEVRSAGGGTTPLLAMGKHNAILGNFYSGRVLGYSPGTIGWFTLSGFGQPQRTNGWHTLTCAIKTDSIDFYVDGNLAASEIPRTAGQAVASALIGSGLSSAGGAAWYDDLCIEVGALHFNPIPPAPPTIVAPILPGAPSVTVTDIDTNATLVSLFQNGNPYDAQDPGGNDTFVFTLSSPAVGGHVYTARQTVGTLTSDLSDPVTVLLPGPTIYKAPADDETSVRVLDVPAGASLVEVLVDTFVRGSINPAGASSVVVPLPSFSLTMGETVTARTTVSGILSVESAAETVTTNGVTGTLLCDDFDSYADQTALEVVYEAVNFASSPNETIHVLTDQTNATVGGVKSLQSLNTAQYRTTPQGNPFPGIQGTDTDPLVFNVSIYDPTAAPGTDEWASLVNWTTLGGGTGFFLGEIGMATTGFTGGPETHYQGRLIGNGGPNWFQLDQYEAPTRSIGWHVFTMVFKGPAPGNTTGHEVDFYVDGLLARKNVVLTTDTLAVTPLIGSGQTSSDGAWYDDFCAELGPVRFNAVEPPCPTIPGDMDGSGIVDLADVDKYATCVDLASPLAHFAAGCGCADLNGDVVVDLRDFMLLQELLD